MITQEQFYKGRDKQYASDLTPEIKANAVETLRRVNGLLDRFYALNPGAEKNRGCNSGWRPPAVNASVENAAKRSKHMLGQAIDVEDIDGALDKWLMTDAGKAALVEFNLWMEHPNATPRWCHLQTVPPRSGKRVFYP